MEFDKDPNISTENHWAKMDWHPTFGGLSQEELKTYNLELDEYMTGKRNDTRGRGCISALLGIWRTPTTTPVTEEDINTELNSLYASQKKYFEDELDYREQLVQSVLNILK